MVNSPQQMLMPISAHTSSTPLLSSMSGPSRWRIMNGMIHVRFIYYVDFCIHFPAFTSDYYIGPITFSDLSVAHDHVSISGAYNVLSMIWRSCVQIPVKANLGVHSRPTSV